MFIKMKRMFRRISHSELAVIDVANNDYMMMHSECTVDDQDRPLIQKIFSLLLELLALFHACHSA